MIPLLLCGGFKPYTVILLSPVFFSLGESNSFLFSPSFIPHIHVKQLFLHHIFCSSLKSFTGVLHASRFQFSESLHGCRYLLLFHLPFNIFFILKDFFLLYSPNISFLFFRFSAWVHCDLWVICIISFCPNW